MLLGKVVGLRLENVMIDILHTIDLGVCAHAVIRVVYGGGTYKERVKSGKTQRQGARSIPNRAQLHILLLRI